MRGRITEADLAKILGAGSFIRRVLVFEVGDEFACAIRFGTSREWRVISLQRYKAPKRWQDFRTLQRMLRSKGYSGPILTVCDGQERLTAMFNPPP